MSEYERGSRWRVTKEGARLWGLRPLRNYAQEGWRMDLPMGTVLTSQGESMTMGDGVPAIKWADADGEWLANDCIFHPAAPGRWGAYPHPDYLERVKGDQ